MQLLKLLSIGLCLSFVASSCNTSKIAFGNSYYFKQTPKEVVTRTAAVPRVDATELTASSQAGALAFRTPVAIPQPLADAALRYEHANKELERTDLSHAEKRMLKAEKRTQKKVFKSELKKISKSQKQADVGDRTTGLIKAGIIVGAAGLVMLLIGILVSGGAVLSTLGGIFLAIGVVLILLKVL